MILYTLDIKKNHKIYIAYFIISILCLIINFIYSKFSHGVSSDYMTYLFLYPLIGGIILFLFFKAFNIKIFNISLNLYNSSILTLTIGSLLKGIFEIAGTSSPFQIYYMTAGYFLFGFSIITNLVFFLRLKSD